MNELIACCGLDCEKCDARIATVTNDEALREKTAALWSQLCSIRSCVWKKGLDTCADCAQMASCETLGRVTNRNPAAMDNLQKLLIQK